MTLTDKIIELKRKKPYLSNKEISKITGASKRHVRRVVAVLSKDISSSKDEQQLSDESFYKLSLMAGLRKKTIPIKYRRFLANIVMAMEDAIPKQPVVNLSVPKSGKESAVLLLSDLHIGKRVYDDYGNSLYDKNIAVYRLSLLKEKVKMLLTKYLHLDNIDEFVICLLGDIIDGSGVYEGQELNQDLTCWSDQLSVAIAGIWDLVLEISKLGLPIRIFGVPGNHTRQSKFAPINNNLDYIVLQFLSLLSYKNKNVNVTYSTVTPYLNFKIKNQNIHIRHIAPPQTETASAKAKFGGWQGIHDYSIICFGHKHHSGAMTYLDTNVLMNGSPVGIDDLAESMGTFSRPSQKFFGISESIGGISFIYNIYLDKKYDKSVTADDLLRKYPNLK